ncbi:unknown similar to AMEV240 [Mythimna separata entomopoxvirus 'L']|uniref:Uncharacterized protein n=1 Tax=Mythimna separata entomopoxvirus 'L' TaxID=1293572 RepID=A0A916KQF7_9POXV|nr:unknown similar to AMEV240 [Mythimna separata entomopoxvirus 'L']CCU56462.1 unknown similar to AMEV240 [Mythimna separata entomopoxvirus 'L']
MDILLIASKVSHFSDHNIYTDDEQKLDILNKYNKGLVSNYSKNNKKKYNTIIDNYNDNECDKIISDLNVVDSEKSKILESDTENKKNIIKNKIKIIVNKSISAKKEEDSSQIINTISDNKLKDIITEDVSLKRGILKEDNNLNTYNKKYNVIVANRDKYFIKKLTTFEYNNKTINIIVCGRVDGIIDDLLIESKNRRNRLFNYIPIYERVQLEMYLYLTDLKKCSLIQHYNEEIKVLNYVKDDDFFTEICCNLTSYFKNMFDKNILNIEYNDNKKRRI